MIHLENYIHKFESKAEYAIEEINENIALIEQLPFELKKVLAHIPAENLEKPYRDGGWTGIQVIHHLVDSHLNAYTRFKLAVTENNPTIKPYDENAWAKLFDANDRDYSTSLQLLEALHKKWGIFLSSLNEEDLEKTLFHPESKKTYRVVDMIASYAWHGLHHVAQIKLLTKI